MTRKLTRKNFEFPYIHNSGDPLIKWCWNEFGVPSLDVVIRCSPTKPGWYYENFFKSQSIGTKIHFWQHSDDLVLFSLIWADLL